MTSALSAAILRALEDGLDTSAAIAARVGVSPLRTSNRLCQLTRAGHVRRVGSVPRRGGKAFVRWAAVAAERAPPLAALPPLPDASGMSLTARLLGDPLPGRSAADARGAR